MGKGPHWILGMEVEDITPPKQKLWGGILQILTNFILSQLNTSTWVQWASDLPYLVFQP